MDIDYSRIEPNVVPLLKVMNSFPGLQTTESCGGHKDPQPWQTPEGLFTVLFVVDHTLEGLVSLEFLVWIVNGSGPLQRNGEIVCNSFPPYLNTPGQAHYFAWHGIGDPGKVADELAFLKERFFLTEKASAPKAARVPKLKEHLGPVAGALAPARLLNLQSGILVLPGGERGIGRSWIGERGGEALAYLGFKISPDDEGFFVLEFMAWAKHAAELGELHLRAEPPFHGVPGQALAFEWVFPLDQAVEVAARANELFKRHFISPAELRAYNEREDGNA